MAQFARACLGQIPLPMNPPSSTTGSSLGAELREDLARRLDDPPLSPRPAPVVPDHTLMERIGSGAYGEVWLAQTALGTRRAVKVVYRSHFKEDRPYEREFHGILKYEPISRSHEGLVQILHVGRQADAGCFYYVMELADTATPQGTSPDVSPDYAPRTLRSELARHRRLPAREAAQLVLRLAEALHHLHAHGLVHRDIKPSNIIFVEGRPKLADIGLVTDVGSSQSFVGTEGFIPPEGPGTPQADLFGLGKLLYELATGLDRLDFPRLPLEDPALLELNEVMVRACAPKAADRYAQATELQADLNLFLGGRSLRRMRLIERHLARLKRFAMAASALMLLAAGTLWFLRNEHQHATKRAQVESGLRQRAEAAERATREQLFTALLEQARATVRSGELGQRMHALDALRRAAAITNTAELRREMIAALTLPDLEFQTGVPLGEEATVREPDPQLQHLAICRGRGPVELVSMADLQSRATFPASTNLPAYFATWSTDGRYLAVKRDHVPSGERANMEIWSASTGRMVWLVHDASWNAVAFRPGHDQVLLGRTHGELLLWDLRENRELQRIPMAEAAFGLAFAPDGQRFASVSPRHAGSKLEVRDLDSTKVLCAIELNEVAHSLAWHPDGTWLAVPDHSGAVHRVDARTGERRLIGRHKAQAASAAFHPTGQFLLTGGWERELICWDLASAQRAFDIPLDGYVARFREDGRQVAILTRAGLEVHTFHVPSGFRAFPEPLGTRLRRAALSPDGRWLAASGRGGLGVWDLKQPGPGTLEPEAYEAQPLFTPDSRELYASRTNAQDEEGYRWRIQSASRSNAPPQLKPLPWDRPEGFCSIGLGGNRRVITGSRGSRLVDVTGGTTTSPQWMPTHRGINGVSPDGEWMGIFRPFTPFLYLHRLPGLEREAKLTHLANISGFTFSPDSEEVAIASLRGVSFWNIRTLEPTGTLTNVTDFIYTPDRATGWLAWDLRLAGLYHLRTLEPLVLLPKGMLPLCLSPDGRRLVVAVETRQLQVWDLAEVRRTLHDNGMDWADPR